MHIFQSRENIKTCIFSAVKIQVENTSFDIFTGEKL